MNQDSIFRKILVVMKNLLLFIWEILRKYIVNIRFAMIVWDFLHRYILTDDVIKLSTLVLAIYSTLKTIEGFQYGHIIINWLIVAIVSIAYSIYLYRTPVKVSNWHQARALNTGLTSEWHQLKDQGYEVPTLKKYTQMRKEGVIDDNGCYLNNGKPAFKIK